MMRTLPTCQSYYKAGMSHRCTIPGTANSSPSTTIHRNLHNVLFSIPTLNQLTPSVCSLPTLSCCLLSSLFRKPPREYFRPLCSLNQRGPYYRPLENSLLFTFCLYLINFVYLVLSLGHNPMTQPTKIPNLCF